MKAVCIRTNHQHQTSSFVRLSERARHWDLGATQELWPRSLRTRPPTSAAILPLGRVPMPFLTKGPCDGPSGPGSVYALEPQVSR